MTLRMVSLSRAADGRWFARKGIPEDVREEHARLHGYRWEAQLKLPADTPRHEAKTRLAEWEAEIETRIATLRAKKNGEGQPLTKLNALPLLAAGTTGSSNNARPILVPRSVGKSSKITSSTTCFIPRRLIATTRTLRQTQRGSGPKNLMCARP